MTPMTSTQLLIVWALLGFLLAWMIIFALLALRPETKKNVEFDEAPVHSTPPLATSAPAQLQVLAIQPASYKQTSVGSTGHESPMILEKS